MQSPSMKRFLAQHDFIYEKAAPTWNQAIPLANGELGAMLWGDGNPLILTLDRCDLWDLRRRPKDFPERYNYDTLKQLYEAGDTEEMVRVFSNNWHRDMYHGAINQTRLIPGRMEVRTSGRPVSFSARLDLHQAQATGSIGLTRGRVDWRCFVDSVRDVLVLDLAPADGAEIRSVSIRPSKFTFPALQYPDPEKGKSGKTRWRLQRQTGGGEYVVAWTEVPHAKGPGRTIYLTIASSRRQDGSAMAEALERLETARALGLTKLFREHAAWWADFWSKSFLTIPDAQMENLYYAELYRLGCQSRPGNAFMSGQGVWVQDDAPPGWAAQYCFDMNGQMDTWPSFASNHLEQVEPLAELLWRWLPANREMCRAYYGVEGAMLTSGVDYDGYEVPGFYAANLWPGCGIWACKSLWDYYQYSRDKDFLRERAYPLLREHLASWRAILLKEADGKWHIPCSSSPEYADPATGRFWGRDDSGNLSLLRWAAGALLEAEKILGIRDEESEAWRDIRQNLAPYPTDATQGLLVMEDMALTVSHRHHSHLMAIYPMEDLNVEGSEEDRALIRRSLMNLAARGFGNWCGFSVAWVAALAARAAMPPRAHAMLRLFADIQPMENSMPGLCDLYSKGFFAWDIRLYTPEAGLAWAAALLETLIQSWGGVIRLFPATPEWWGDTAFNRLRTEGAFLISARRREGQTTWVRVESEAGGSCRMRNPFNGPVRLLDETTGKTRRLAGQCLRFSTTKGRAYTLAPWDTAEAADALPRFRRGADQKHWYGLKKRARF